MEEQSFECTACSYKFRRNQSWLNKACPYCGKKGTSVRERMADDILNSV